MAYPEPRQSAAVGGANRSSQEIRRDIELQRQQLGHSVDRLRSRFGELTDWRRQVREHRNELIVGAAAAGFLIGGIVALRRRR
jgi:orotate phosphoribosyltransferase-like protein